MTIDKGKGERIVVRDLVYQGGMCPRCEGMGSVNDINLTQLYDDSKSLNDVWDLRSCVRVFAVAGENQHTVHAGSQLVKRRDVAAHGFAVERGHAIRTRHQSTTADAAAPGSRPRCAGAKLDCRAWPTSAARRPHRSGGPRL